MTRSGPLVPWWDRDADEFGHLLRADVREAGHRVWDVVCAHAHRILGDASDAPELLEAAIRAVSRYLDTQNVPLCSADPAGLLVVAFYRSARRLARQRRRLEFKDNDELAEILRVPDWSDAIDRRLVLEKIAVELSDRNRAILRLRSSGYGWKEIGRMLQTTPTAARQTFWRDIRKLHLGLLQSISGKVGP